MLPPSDAIEQPSSTARGWRRWRWHAGSLVLAAPVWFFYQALSPTFPEAYPEQAIGPFTVQPGPVDDNAPYLHDGLWVKDFSFTFCDGCIAQFRQAYAAVGPEPAEAPERYEGILHGNQYMLHGHVPYVPSPGPDDRLWITVETWDGTRYQQSWALQ